MTILCIAIFIFLFPYCSFSHGISISYKKSAVLREIQLNFVFTFDSVYSNSEGHCALICATQIPCKSLNFFSKNYTCQLNALTLEEYPMGKVTDKDAVYMDKSDIRMNEQCSTKTCSDTGECVINIESTECSKPDLKNCSSDLPVIAHVNVPLSCEISVGSMCSLTCNDNFTSSAPGISGFMICLQTGEWSIFDPKCIPYTNQVIVDCFDLMLLGYNTSGVYNITVKGEAIEAYCDMETEGGGWTVVTERFDGSVDFNRSWNAYKFGFGDSEGEYWLGNEYIHALTWERNYEAYFKLLNENNTFKWAWYPKLYLHSEEEGYKIIFNRTYSGNAGQTLDLGNSAGTIQGMLFTTYDKDQDLSSANYAVIKGGGWWYKRGAYSILTAPYESLNYAWRDTGKLQTSTMMVRPIQEN